MADGSITFSTALDNKQLESDLRDAVRDVKSLEKKLEGQEFERSWLEKMMDRTNVKLEQARQRVDQLKGELAALQAEQGGVDDSTPEGHERWLELNDQILAKYRQIASAQQEANGRLDEWFSHSDKWDVANAKVETYQEELERARAKASLLADEARRQAPIWKRAAEAVRSRFAAVAEGIRAKMAEAASKSVSPWEQFTKRVGGLVKRVFVFSAVLKGLNAIRERIASMLMANERFSASVQNLKAVANGMLSALASAVLPALTALVNTLAGAFERIAGLVDALFGTRILAAIQAQRALASQQIQSQNAERRAKYEDQVAKAQEKQAKAARKLEKAQEKANRQLMAFDEINAMSADSAEDATDALQDYMEGIEEPEYEADWTRGSFGDVGMLQGVLDWLDELKRRILTDVEGPFARIREGLQRIAEGWGKVVKGFRTGDLGLIWEGITDIVVGACYVIEGAFAALMDWLDEATGGRFTDIFQGLSEIVSGAVKVIEGILTGDFGMIVDGVGQILAGLHQTVVGVLEGIKAVFGDLMDWLDEATGGRFHDVFEGMKRIVAGAADFLVGLLTLDIPMAFEGLREVVDGLAQFLTGAVDAVVGAISLGVSAALDALSDKFPELSGFFQSTKRMILGVVDSISSFVKDAIEGLRLLVQGALDIIAGTFTLNGELVLRGIDRVAAGIRTVVDGAVGAVRGILESLFGWVRDGVSGLFDFLAGKFPELTSLFGTMRDHILGVLEVIRGTALGLLDGIRAALDGFLDGMRQAIEGALQVVAGIFTLSGDQIVEGLKGIINGFISVVEGLLDGVIDGVVGFANGIIDGLSMLPGVDIPSITFTSVNLPRLAQGAVIPPNREFMAVLGDQAHGNNIETPEALMRQVVREEAGQMLAEAILALSSQREEQGGDVHLVLQVGNEVLARAVSKGNASLVRRGELVPEIAFGM